MSIEFNPKEFLWWQKYRPTKVKDAILPTSLKEMLQGFVDGDRIPNFIFYGSRGIGKTTAAIAMCEEIGADYLFIGSSEDRGIDVVRTKLRTFASAYSISGAKKVVILDEADGLTSDAQEALRGFIEEFSKSCSFILTCNFIGKIIEPMYSRCPPVEFKIAPSEKPALAQEFYKRCCQILKQEDVTFNRSVVAEIVTKHFPDFRRTLAELQRLSINGSIGVEALIENDTKIVELVTNLKDKKFNEVRKWVANNSDVDCATLFRELYDKSSEICQPQSIPEMVMILADYGYKSAFVVDREINTMAALTEIMLKVNWK